MKKTVLIILAFIGILSTSCGPSTEDAIEYNDNIIKEHMNVQIAFDALDASFENFDPETMNNAWQNAKTQTEISLKKIEDMDSFEEKSTYKENALKFFQVYVILLDDYYIEMVDIYSIPDEKYTEVDEARFSELNEEMKTIYFPAFEQFIKDQEAFAKEYDFEIDKKTE